MGKAWSLLFILFLGCFALADDGVRPAENKVIGAEDTIDEAKFLAAKAKRAEELLKRRTRGQELARQKAYNKRIAKEWATFSEQFVIRETVPIYSGIYQTGSKVIVRPNYPAIAEYRRQLEIKSWNAMTDQQKRDMALFVIAKNTGAIAESMGTIADGVNEIADLQRREEVDRFIDRTWPGR